MRLEDITGDGLRTAFSSFAAGHAAASARRCWSTWNTVCTVPYSSELIPGNPMSMVGRAKLAKTLPKALPPNVIDAILGDLARAETQPQRRDDWVHRDRALVLTALLAGLSLDELVGMNISDVHVVEDGGVLHVRGKGDKDQWDSDRSPTDRAKDQTRITHSTVQYGKIAQSRRLGPRQPTRRRTTTAAKTCCVVPSRRNRIAVNQLRRARRAHP